MAHNRAKPGLGKSSFGHLFDVASNREELGFLDFFKAGLQGEWAAVPKWDYGPRTRVRMSQTGFVHQIRSLQNCSWSHKVPSPDMFLPTSLLQSHHVFCCSILGRQSCLARGCAATQTVLVAKNSTVKTVQRESKIPYAFNLLQSLRLYHEN